MLLIKQEMNNKNIKEIKPIPISNIKFFVFKQKPKLKLTSSPKTNQQNISPTKNNHYQSIFASFIPKNCNIRSRAKIEKEVKYMKEPFYPRNASLSKFPSRKPLSVKSNRSITSNRYSKIFPWSNFMKNERNQDQQNFYKSYTSAKNSKMARSCLTFNHKELQTQPFIRYTNSSFQSETRKNTVSDMRMYSQEHKQMLQISN